MSNQDLVVNLITKYFADERRVLILQELLRQPKKMLKLSRNTGMSQALLSYYIFGGNKGMTGLIEFGLVRKVCDENNVNNKPTFYITKNGRSVLKILRKNY